MAGTVPTVETKNALKVSGPADTRFVTAIDQCSPAPGGGMHFDIHPTAYCKMKGDAGVLLDPNRLSIVKCLCPTARVTEDKQEDKKTVQQ